MSMKDISDKQLIDYFYSTVYGYVLMVNDRSNNDDLTYVRKDISICKNELLRRLEGEKG